MQIIVFKVVKGSFIPNSIIHLCSRKKKVSLQRKPSMLEAAASSTLFPCEN
jgi:hypothetical protein